MNLSECRKLKEQFLQGDVWKGISGIRTDFAASVRKSGHAGLPKVPLAFGITATKGTYQVAVRIQHDVAGIAGVDSVLENVSRQAHGDVNVRLTGPIKKQLWHRQENRPLQIGGSCHHAGHIAAGTLGCFATQAAGSQDEDYILSNNHVLANENSAKTGDAVLQPGRLDGGKVGQHTVGRLERFIRLKRTKNRVDAAIASLDEGLEYYYNWLQDHGPLKGVRTRPLEIGETVHKIGRTTGVTSGRISAIELSNVRVEYDTGVLSFDNQIEIERAGSKPFSKAGDSGSLIFDDDRRAVGLLFAGNDIDLTYANPIDEVLSALKIKLVS